MMSEKKFKVGDRVRIKGRTCISTIMYMKDGWVSVDTPIKTAESYPEDDVEYIDPRTAFLQELKELLRKYDASITSVAVYADDNWVEACVGSELVASTKGKSVDFTADNIMDCVKG